MAESSIPVDLLNPGQVFACLGLLELADKLLGNAQGAFDWSTEGDTTFRLSTQGADEPVGRIIATLAEAEIFEVEPLGWTGEISKKARKAGAFPSPLHYHRDNDGDYKRTKLPITLQLGESALGEFSIEHWTDFSSRPDFKLYAGNRSGFSIACDMVHGKRSKPTKEAGETKVLNWGVEQLWRNNPTGLSVSPFDVLVPMAGSFNFDARGAWTPIDEGFSPDKQSYSLQASPLVEILAVVALENMRPREVKRGVFQYCAWSDPLSPELARIAIQGHLPEFRVRRFEFALGYSGKNKIVSFAEEPPEQLATSTQQTKP